ncbi:MAG: cupin domain-containing protein [Gammaproteobacteria bacterium]|jgi:mannose-6-phosphate isomerase-like protein (cupin superfamily)|nr:cupin domain-containing protein [Gammaproteobacteria bacterium]
MNEQAAARPPDWYIPASEAGEFWTGERCYITELLNTDKSPEVSLAVARIEPGVHTQLHSLTGIEEVYVVRSGRGVIEIDGVEQELAEGDQAIVPASAAQRVRNTGGDDLCCYCLCRPRFRPECYVDLESGAS